MDSSIDLLSSLLPIDFFQVSLDLYEGEKGEIERSLGKSHLLPDFSPFLAETSNGKVEMGWRDDGLIWRVAIEGELTAASLDNFRRASSIELFVDTRDLKSSSFPTPFCHHFVCLLQSGDLLPVHEIPLSKWETGRALADPEQIHFQLSLLKKGAVANIFIPSESLHGYDPSSFGRLGFAYRINGVAKGSHHFALSSEVFAIETHPGLWSSMQLRRR